MFNVMDLFNAQPNTIKRFGQGSKVFIAVYQGSVSGLTRYELFANSYLQALDLLRVYANGYTGYRPIADDVVEIFCSNFEQSHCYLYTGGRPLV